MSQYNPELEQIVEEELEEELDREATEELDSALDEDLIVGPKEPVSIKLSQFAEFALNIFVRGELTPFRFDERKYLRAPYDTPARSVLLFASRQVEKSTMLGNKALGYATIIPGISVLYTSSSSLQTKEFSKDRISEPIKNSPVLSKMFDKREQNVLSKRAKNGSTIRMRYAYLNADRCLHGDTQVELADGSARTVKELSNSGDVVSVVSVGADNCPCISEGARAFKTGVKYTVVVNTDYPVPIKVSFDHPFFTQRGWVQAIDLTTTDFVFAPHTQPVLGKIGIGTDMAWIIGAMTAEGNCTNYSKLRFTNSSEKYLEEFEHKCHRVGLILGPRSYDKRKVNSPCCNISICSDKEGRKKYLWKIGEFGKYSYEKRIPKCIFTSPIQDKAAFLHGLFSGDGWCSPDKGGARVGYSTASKALAEDLIRILWQLGIRANLRTKKPSSKNSSISYVVDFTKHPSKQLTSITGDFRPSKYDNKGKRDCKDRIPITYKELSKYIVDKYDITRKSAVKDYGINLYPGNTRSSVGRRVLFNVANKLNDEYLFSLCDPDKSWVRVKSVEEVGPRVVYDLTVDGNSNFIGNGLLLHNTRGIRGDVIDIDEIQHIIPANIPVIEQCAFHSELKIRVYSGTPLSLDNTIEVLRDRHSTQNEWIVPCRACGLEKDRSTWHWNVLGPKNIGKKGPICAKCGRYISPADPDAGWYSLQPITEENRDRVTFEGYRITQLMVPFVNWQEDIIEKREEYDDARFYNEVCGLSYDSGARPITKSQLVRASKSDVDMSRLEHNVNLCNREVFAGIDWGQDTINSFTVISLGGYMPHGFQIFFSYRFTGKDIDPEIQLEKISEILGSVKFKLCGSDYGGGFGRNDNLIKRFGHMKFARYMYSENPGKKIGWKPDKYIFVLHRTEIMTDIFTALKERKIRIPNWEQYKDPYGMDIRNIFSEFNEQKKMIQYRNSPGKPDDTFHSILYCLLASMLVKPRYDIIIPTKEDAIDNSRPGIDDI